MLVLEASNIKKYYSDRLILEFDELKVFTGDRIGIVGQNGSGKTTLLNILSNETEPDEGFARQYCNAAYIRQFSEDSVCADPKSLKEFKIVQLTQQEALSGGEKTRIKIANAFSRDNLLLFADEPTASLDYKGVELFKQKISEVDTFLLISHDRDLLDGLCNKIIEIKDGKLKTYNGNYSFYRIKLQEEMERMQSEYLKYQDEKTKLEEVYTYRKRLASDIGKKPRVKGSLYADSSSARSKGTQEKNMHRAANAILTRLEKLEVKEKPKEPPKIKLDFTLTCPPENKIVISAEKLSFGYENRRIFNNAGFRIYNGTKTAIWGENGTGKTTLLNLINGRLSDSIYIVPKARIGYLYQGFENLEYDKSVLENVMKDSVQTQTVARTILARLLIQDTDVYKKVGVLSGGERIKVSFAKLLVSNANVLLLDEPTNYLDVMSMEALENVIRDYEGTVLFVSHDSAFINSVATRMLIIENQAIKEFDGNLKEYRASCQKTQAAVKTEIETTILKMRISEIVAKLSRPDADKESLEAEFQSLIARLKN